VPAIAPSDQAVPAAQLELSERVRSEVRAFLDERRVLTCELQLEAPTYTWVSIIARVRARPRTNKARLAERATRALYAFVHPTGGGADGQGWPFGRELVQGEVFSLLQAVEGVDFVEEVALHQVNPASREFSAPATRLAPMDNGLICSYEHRVLVD
jgi:hypothetical protein